MRGRALGAFLVAAGLSSPQDHALCSLLALNGLRVSEALGADIDAGVHSAMCKRPRRTPTPGAFLPRPGRLSLISWSTHMLGPVGSFVTRLITRELRMLWAWQLTGAG